MGFYKNGKAITKGTIAALLTNICDVRFHGNSGVPSSAHFKNSFRGFYMPIQVLIYMKSYVKRLDPIS